MSESIQEKIARMKREAAGQKKVKEETKSKAKAEETTEKAEEPKTKKRAIKKETPKESEKVEETTEKAEEPKTKNEETEEPTKELATISNNLPALPSSGFDIKLPTANDLLKSGQLVGVGRADIINSVMGSFLPITKVRAAHANNEPEHLGKAVFGKLGEAEEWDYNIPLIPISFHAWTKISEYNGKEEKYLTVFFINPDDTERIICVSGKNYGLDRIKKVALGGIRKIWTIAGVDLIDTKWTDKGKEKTGKTPVLRFEDITSMVEDFEISPADVEYGLNIVAQHLTQFYNKFPEQHPDNQFMGDDVDETADIPF
jgi:hypothetical protein